MLSNEKFVNNAKKEKIEVEKDKARNYLEQFQEVLSLCKKDNIKIDSKIDIKEIEKILK